MTNSDKKNQSQWGESDPYTRIAVSPENCFLCGTLLLDHKSDEHIFPKWLLRKHNLWNSEITLPNGTSIPYRKLTIPCCVECNTKYLSQLESKMEKAFRIGAEAVYELDEKDVFLWVAKIVYGLLFKACFLISDRSKPNSKTMANPDGLEQLYSFHGFLQALKQQINFVKPYPWSIFVLKTHTYPGEKDFDWHGTPVKVQTITIRSHGIGIIAILMDNSLLRGIYGKTFDKLKSISLHPMQFDELAAMVIYQSSLINIDRSSYLSVGPNDGKDITVRSLPPYTISDEPFFKKKDIQSFSIFLEFFWHQYGISYSDIYLENDKYMTTVRTDDNQFPILDRDGTIIGTENIW